MLKTKGMEMTTIPASLTIFKHLGLIVPLSTYPSLKGQVRADRSHIVHYLHPLTSYHGSPVSHLAVVVASSLRLALSLESDL